MVSLRVVGQWLVATLAIGMVACGGNGKTPTNPTDAGGMNMMPPTKLCLDNDGDGYAGTGECGDVAEAELDCNDLDPSAHPGATEMCNGADDDCNGQVDDGLTVSSYYQDADNDGVGGSTKTGEGCGAPPVGSVLSTGDCDDRNPAVKPGAAETCNQVDDDCNGQVDDGLTEQSFYVDTDGDGFGDASGTPVSTCQTTVMGRVPNKQDCNDQNPTIKPGAAELCNRVDDDCDGQIDTGITYADYYPDLDGDGFGAVGSQPESSCAPVASKVTNNTDCNDQSPTTKPGAPELCNGADDNCDGRVDEGLSFSNYYLDADGDGFGTGMPVSACAQVAGRVTVAGDCNDQNPAVKPGAPEVCNGVDDNCSGQADEGLTFQSYFTDADGDGFGAGTAVSACAPVMGRVTNNTDCNDQNPAVKPGATELCNGVDDNCNGQVDDGLTFTNYYPDADGDGFGNRSAPAQSSCSVVSGKVTNNTDCDDTRFAVKPGAAEVCNAIDDNCNGQVDEGLPFTNYYPDLDRDGFGSAAATPLSACSAPAGMVTDHTDCNDMSATVKPGAPETCNGIDDNCDGLIDNGTVTQSYYPDGDGDGFGAAGSTAIQSCAPIAGRSTNNTDCNDGNATVHPGATEVCNGIDDNCNTQIDEGLTRLAYYPDADGDGFGSSSAAAQMSCAPVSGRVTNNTDCNDGNANIRPGATEVCNGIDDNCSGAIDEGLPTISFWPDADGDGFGAVGSTPIQSCQTSVAGRANNNTDCNDANSAVRPNATEVCNGIDDNCVAGIDEGNPGGGASCVTGQSGVCSAGTRTCSSGALNCQRTTEPSTERCNSLDDDCDGDTDETFTDRGATCSAGVGACARTGQRVCAGDGLSTVCNATAGSPTAAACDGIDNDCDGIVDEPYLSSTYNVSSTVAWQDIEVQPFYYSAGSCAGGANGSGSDALAGGGMAMGVGAAGLYFQRLDATGTPTGTPVTGASGLTYTDVALAQAGNGFIVAGLYAGGTGGTADEIDLYYFEGTTGTKLTYEWSLFNTGGLLDSLRVVRGNGKRVTVIWRDATVGLRYVRAEACLVAGTWELMAPGCVTALANAQAGTLVAGTGIQPGVGADDAHADWVSSQTCVTASTLAQVGVAYRSTAILLKQFTVAENGTGKSAEVDVRSVSSTYALTEPDVAYFNSGSAQYAVTYVEKNTSSSQADLDFWLSSAPGYRYAYLSFANVDGANSISRPRISASASNLFMVAHRSVADASGFKRQVMTRTADFTGAKVPTSTTVELSATSGACGADPACRPGDKVVFTNSAVFGRLYYSSTGASPTGAFASVLTCQ